MTMRISPAFLTFLALSLSASSPGALPGTLDLTPLVLRGNVHPVIAAGKVIATVDRKAPMEKMILSLKLSPEAALRRDALLRNQQDPKSPDYHHWLTPAQFGARFGPSQQDLAQVTGWLKSQGFRIDQVANGQGSILFSGTAGAVMDAFRTTIATVDVNGTRFQGNLTDPSIPQGLSGLVNGVVSLNNVPVKAMNTGAKLLSSEIKVVDPHWTSSDGNYHYLAPADFATIYNTTPLLSGGVDGSGMSIAIVGRTDILRSDVESFRNFFKLPPNKLAITYNGPNPGINADEIEADLDVDWSGAAAPNATVEFVVSGDTATTSGIFLSQMYIIDNDLAPVASMSYGGGEVANGAAASTYFDAIYAQAAAEGQSWFISSGDAGCAGGDAGNDQGVYYPPIQVNGLGSSAYNVAVGGTMFNEGAGTYWATTNDAFHESALGYIPEAAWNESGIMPGGYGDWSTGGGISAFVPQPWWQASLVPGQTFRAVPDVALSAAGHDAYVVAMEGSLVLVSGTSASSPSFAGLMSLVVQKTGQRQGNPNPVLYQLGANQYLGDGPMVFHDVTVGNNSVPYQTGYSAGVGYDECTGLGSVDASALAGNWIMGSSNVVTAGITSPAAPVAFVTGGTQSFTAAGTDNNPLEILTYTWNFGDGTFATGQSVTHTFAATPGIPTSNYPVVLTVSDSTGNLAGATMNVRVTSADLNGDGARTLLDLLQWSIDMTTGNLNGDLNSDGLVNDADLTILLGAL